MEEPMTPHGKFVWNELMTHDLARAKKFYGDVLGWSFEAQPMDDWTYWIVQVGDQSVGGMFEMIGPDFANMPEQWIPYVAVDDVDARFKQSVDAGASVMRAPFDVPTVGRIAMLRDPADAVIAWITPVM